MEKKNEVNIANYHEGTEHFWSGHEKAWFVYGYFKLFTVVTV